MNEIPAGLFAMIQQQQQPMQQQQQQGDPMARLQAMGRPGAGQQGPGLDQAMLAKGLEGANGKYGQQGKGKGGETVNSLATMGANPQGEMSTAPSQGDSGTMDLQGLQSMGQGPQGEMSTGAAPQGQDYMAMIQKLFSSVGGG